MEQDQNTLFANYEGMLRYGHPVPVYKNDCAWKAFELFIPGLDKEVCFTPDLMKAMCGVTGTVADQLGTENVPSLSQVTGEVAGEVTGEVTDQDNRQVPDKHPTSTRQVTLQESSVLKAAVNPSSRSALQEASGIRNRETRKGKEGMLYNRKSSAENVTVNALFAFLVTFIGVYVSEKCDYHIVTALSVAT